jgi:competence protein ComFC
MLSVAEILNRILFPKFCLICNKNGCLLCATCESRLKLNTTTLPNWIISKYQYKDDNVRHLLFKLKYGHTAELGFELGKYSYNFLKEKLALADYILIPVPISKRRERERGYNQAALIAEGIASSSENIKVVDSLSRTKHTNKLFKTENIDQRKNEIQNSFTINPELLGNIQNQKILIIDDITTTGVTLYEIKNLLIKNGVEENNIKAYTVAH